MFSGIHPVKQPVKFKLEFIDQFRFFKDGTAGPCRGPYFLRLHKKVGKELSLGEALSCLLPQTKPPPLRTPPGAHFRWILQGFGAVSPKSETFFHLTQVRGEVLRRGGIGVREHAADAPS